MTAQSPGTAATDWAEALSSFAHHLEQTGRAEATTRTYLKDLRKVARVVPVGPWQLTSERVAVLLADPAWSRGRRQKLATALRAFYGWAARQGLVDEPPIVTPRQVMAARQGLVELVVDGRPFTLTMERSAMRSLGEALVAAAAAGAGQPSTRTPG